jgi:hypothetical protein
MDRLYNKTLPGNFIIDPHNWIVGRVGAVIDQIKQTPIRAAQIDEHSK